MALLAFGRLVSELLAGIQYLLYPVGILLVGSAIFEAINPMNAFRKNTEEEQYYERLTSKISKSKETQKNRIE